MMMRSTALLLAACLAAPVAAQCPDNTLFNGSFEIEDAFFPGAPEGWRTFGGPVWSTDFARTGSYSYAMGSPSAGTFIGFDTFINDINTGDLYDPPYEYAGGDLLVSGYYLTPVGEALGVDGEAPEDNVGIKLEFRRDNTSIYQSFEFLLDDADTNGEWQFFEIVFPADMISDEFPPFPTSVSILPFRFIPFGIFEEGTIYWDDLCVVQLSANTCTPDLNGDGIVDNGDIGAFVNLFLANDLAADFNGDGFLDNGDIGAFVQAFLAGC